MYRVCSKISMMLFSMNIELQEIAVVIQLPVSNSYSVLESTKGLTKIRVRGKDTYQEMWLNMVKNNITCYYSAQT